MNRIFKCPVCSRCVNTSQGLKSHVTRLHKGYSNGESLDLSSRVVEVSSQTFVKTAFTDSSNQSDVSLESLLANLRQNIKILHRIPKGARISAAEALSSTIDKCVQENSVASWERLLLFGASCFQVPINEENRRVSLATLVKHNVCEFLQGRAVGKCKSSRKGANIQYTENQMAKRVEAKVAEGDVTGAVRIMSSEVSFAPFDDDTMRALIKLHPVQNPCGVKCPVPPEPSSEGSRFQVSDLEVRGAILSFPPGSAGGLDMMRPQHLKDLISPAVGNAGLRLLSSIKNLCNVMLAGDVSEEICPVLYGASLCALLKKGGGIRPIAIGSTWRRLVAKMGVYHLRSRLSAELSPVQVGFGIKGGAEAAAHAARRFVSFNHEEPKVFLKIDFQNAFNSVNRSQLLQSASDRMPELYPFLYQCYKNPSRLAFGEEFLSSEMGIQQGDPLGPGLFCLVSHPVATSMRSELNIWYLDDGALGGQPDVVLKDFEVLKSKASELGLKVNSSKCELFVLNASKEMRTEIQGAFRNVAPDIRTPVASECTLLGAPLQLEAVGVCLESKTRALSRVSDRLRLVKAHVAFNILKNSQAIPKLSYILRCSPTWKCLEGLTAFDETLKGALEILTNTCLKEDAWIQSALPIAMGGLGIRQAVTCAIPAFLASVQGVSSLTGDILPTKIDNSGDPMYFEGLSIWIGEFGVDPPAEEKRRFQKEWEAPGLKLSKATIYERAATAKEKARLLGVASRESGAFLNAVPSAALGTLLEDDAFRIAIALRLGSQICQPHICNCGMPVDESGTHGLSCIKSSGRRARHSAVNDIIRRGLGSANIPSALEPPHLATDSNNRPDGVTQIPWSSGKSLVWDFTCTDGMAASHFTSAAVEPLYAASTAEENKRRKYAHLRQSYVFAPIAVECLGSFGRDSLKTVRSIGKKITEATGEKKATEYLLQRISVAVQRGNASSITGTIPSSPSLDEIFNVL